MSYRALGIYREPEFSPGKVEADAAILDATLLELKREGVEVNAIDAVAFGAATRAAADPNFARPDLILPMCQGARALKRLAEAEQAGAIAVNSALSIRNCYRDLLAPACRRLRARWSRPTSRSICASSPGSISRRACSSNAAICMRSRLRTC